ETGRRTVAETEHTLTCRPACLPHTAVGSAPHTALLRSLHPTICGTICTSAPGPTPCLLSGRSSISGLARYTNRMFVYAQPIFGSRAILRSSAVAVVLSVHRILSPAHQSTTQ